MVVIWHGYVHMKQVQCASYDVLCVKVSPLHDIRLMFNRSALPPFDSQCITCWQPPLQQTRLIKEYYCKPEG